MTRLTAMLLVIGLTASCAAAPPAARATPTAARTATGGPTATTAAPAATTSLTPATATPTRPGGSPAPTIAPQSLTIVEFKVGAGQHPHDVAPAADGGVWYTSQLTGELGWLDPKNGQYQMTRLGTGSSPHGVIVGRDGHAYVTDSGLNAIVRVDGRTKQVTVWRLPAERANANLNTAAFDDDGTLWFTGQNGVFGRLNPQSGEMAVFDAPRGRGPYGIHTCPDGEVYYASLAGSYVGRIVRMTGGATVLEPATAGQGARRVWCDSKANVWVSEWNSGQVSRYNPTDRSWKQWKLPGSRPQTYAVYVDESDVVWLTDFGANALVRFDPATETFTSLPHPAANAAVRQLLGRAGEVWGAMSGQDKLMLVRTR